MRTKKRTKADRKQAAKAYENLCKTSLSCKPSKTAAKQHRNEVRHKRRVVRAKLAAEAEKIKIQNDLIALAKEERTIRLNTKLLKTVGIDITETSK